MIRMQDAKCARRQSACACGSGTGAELVSKDGTDLRCEAARGPWADAVLLRAVMRKSQRHLVRRQGVTKNAATCRESVCRPAGHGAHLLAVLVEHDEVGVVAIGGELDNLLEREAVPLVVLRGGEQLLRAGHASWRTRLSGICTPCAARRQNYSKCVLRARGNVELRVASNWWCESFYDVEGQCTARGRPAAPSTHQHLRQEGVHGLGGLVARGDQHLGRPRVGEVGCAKGTTGAQGEFGHA